MDEILVDVALIMVCCGAVLLIPMSAHVRTQVAAVLVVVSLVVFAVAMARRWRQL